MRVLDPESGLWFTASLGIVVLVLAVTGVALFYRSGRSLTLVAISPFAIAAATWLVLFVYRPIELYVSPDHAALGLAQLGFSLGDLTRTVALAGLGCSTWCAGYLLGFGRLSASQKAPVSRPLVISKVGAAVVFSLGTFLWVVLFIRLGGIQELLRSAVSLRSGQFGGSYGFVGVWLVQGAVLYAWAAYLQHPNRTAKRMLLVGVPIAVLAAVAVQLRMHASFAVVSGLAIYAILRPIRRKHVVAGAVLAVTGVLALGFAQQVREYTTTVSTPDAIRLAAKTPLQTMYTSDLSTFDNFVAFQDLVPISIPYLEGESLLEIPQAFVPRAIWPGKPLAVDFRASSYLYPGDFVAIPVSVHGELYWNGGVVAVAFGTFVLGVLFGGTARIGLRTAPGGRLFVLYAVALPFTHAFLTRGLAPMSQNLAFALIGTSLAIAGMSGSSYWTELKSRALRGAGAA